MLTWICRSNRPGRSSARSRISGRFVAATITTPWLASKPSISASSWFSVCSLSSLVPIALTPARDCPIASISSMNTMHGAFALACTNRSRTRAAPTPTNSSTKPEPLIEKNGTPASPAVARARSVLPVPGRPTSSTPFGSFAPSLVKRSGSFRNSMISLTSTSTSSTPPISSNVTPVISPAICRARLFPIDMTPAPPPWPMRRKTKYQIARSGNSGSTHPRSMVSALLACGSASKVTSASRSREIRSGSSIRTTL